MPSDVTPTRKPDSNPPRKAVLRLFLILALVQVAVTTSVLVAGRMKLMPSQFSADGLGAFAADGSVYKDEVMELAQVLKADGLRAWARWPTQLHVRIYSLPLVVLSRWMGFNILAVEPVNLIYYLAILFLVFKLGETMLDRRVGILAATIVGLWPSFLLHTTQLLRDPLLIAAFLILMGGLAFCLRHGYQWQKGVAAGVACAVAVVVIRIVRMPMWDVLWAIALISTCLVVIGFIRFRAVQLGSVLFLALIFAALLVTPHFQYALRDQQRVPMRRVMLPEEIQKLPLADQIARRREGFGLQVSNSGGVEASSAGSDLNNNDHFTSPKDILLYIPRAALVGFFAPFPNMWWAAGKQVGLSGRLLAGAESILTYLIEGFAVIGFWNRRKDLSLWFLSLAAAVGVVALGLIVSNMGAMYRLRYPFWILIVIVGASGMMDLFAAWQRRRKLSLRY